MKRLLALSCSALVATHVQWRQNPDSLRSITTDTANRDSVSAAAGMQSSRFPSAVERYPQTREDGEVTDYTKDLADFFVQQGGLPQALDSYASHITTRFLR